MLLWSLGWPGYIKKTLSGTDSPFCWDQEQVLTSTLAQTFLSVCDRSVWTGEVPGRSSGSAGKWNRIVFQAASAGLRDQWWFSWKIFVIVQSGLLVFGFGLQMFWVWTGLNGFFGVVFLPSLSVFGSTAPCPPSSSLLLLPDLSSFCFTRLLSFPVLVVVVCFNLCQKLKTSVHKFLHACC